MTPQGAFGWNDAIQVDRPEDIRARLEDALRTLPPPGQGYHARLLGVANIGIRAGVPPPELAEAIRAHTPAGARHVRPREIEDAVEKAARENEPGRTYRPALPPPRRPAGPRFDARAFMAARLAEGDGYGEADIWEASPVRIETPPEQDAALLLSHLYRPDDVLFIGDQYARAVKTVAEWQADFLGRATVPPLEVPPHIIPNPLTGSAAETKDGRPSFRADSCVKSFRFAVAEFDGLSREDQLRFWWAVNLPVCALLDSGGKSLHAWVKVDGVETAEQWTARVEGELFGRYLIPLGCDAACRNEARLSRMPGSFRGEKGRWQRILYLAPQGRRIGG